MFTNNYAYQGGGLSLANSSGVFNGTVIEFIRNKAVKIGGGIVSKYSRILMETELIFIGNYAAHAGGAIHCQQSIGFQVKSASFINNSASSDCGGAMYVYQDVITYTDVTITGNSGTALCIVESNLTFSGVTRISNNVGVQGGGMKLQFSSVLLTDNTTFENNRAHVGGAIRGLYNATLSIGGVTIFTHNTADGGGGAIYATDTHIILSNVTYFMFNSAQHGGAMYFRTGAKLLLEPNTTLSSSHNHASEYGGVIYHEDNITPAQCNFNQFLSNGEPTDVIIADLPGCFIEMKGISYNSMPYSMLSSNDSAGKNGRFLYGGLIDKCQILIFEAPGGTTWTLLYPVISKVLRTNTRYNATNDLMTSEVYQLCFCKSTLKLNCSEVRAIEVYRGQKFNVSLLALAQGGIVASTTVTAKSPRARLKPNQNLQAISNNCTTIGFNFYSIGNNEKLILYPDGSCRDTGLARAMINVTLLPCPNGFNKSDEQCDCEERLKRYGAECTIDEHIYITRKADSKFWMGTWYANETYRGLIFSKVCPAEYCKTEGINMTLDDLDIQCNLNRKGQLCGQCNTNYSLMFGSSRCEECQNTYLALLVPFAVAGIVLVIFLSFLRLTVATGMVNSLILYANIIQANKYLFFTDNTRNILTVFIAWLNLDLGFQTCFYHGMDAYAQTWLQLAFPLYVWILISLIIITSRYSITMSKLIGHNPIAVLATLMLMSYTKVLKIIIEVYSFVELDYPDSKSVRVWLKDANVPFLESKHLVLTAVTALILFLFFLPYTLLLLLGHKLYLFTGRKHFRWLNRIKPLLDSYYAPYNKHTRYWTGFLLLIRCALYIVFSFNSLVSTTKSPLAINITFTALVIIAWIHVSIYKSFYVNVIEASVYLNLLVLSAATLANANSPALVYSLVGKVFAIMIIIIVYHFHLFYTAKTSAWLKFQARMTCFRGALKRVTAGHVSQPPPMTSNRVNASSHDPHRIITKTEIDLREPLLDN